MEIRSRPMTFEEQFFKPASSAAQPALINAKVPGPAIKPVTLVSKPELDGKQLHSSDFLTKASNFANDNFLAIIAVVIVGVGAVWLYKVNKAKALLDSAAAKLANRKAEEQATKSAAQNRPANPIGGEQTYQNASNEDSIDVQANRDWKQYYQQPI